MNWFRVGKFIELLIEDVTSELLNTDREFIAVKPVYSGPAIKRTSANSGHFFKEPA